jgi:hypothetical protein
MRRHRPTAGVTTKMHRNSVPGSEQKCVATGQPLESLKGGIAAGPRRSGSFAFVAVLTLTRRCVSQVRRDINHTGAADLWSPLRARRCTRRFFSAEAGRNAAAPALLRRRLLPSQCRDAPCSASRLLCRLSLPAQRLQLLIGERISRRPHSRAPQAICFLAFSGAHHAFPQSLREPARGAQPPVTQIAAKQRLSYQCELRRVGGTGYHQTRGCGLGGHLRDIQCAMAAVAMIWP